MSVGSILATGVKALAFTVLDASSKLNALADRVSGGKVNRDTLAQSVMRSALTSGIDIAAKSYKHSLGDKAAVWLPLVRDLALQNDSNRIEQAALKLAEMGADSAIERAGLNPDGIAAKLLRSAASSTGAELAKALVPEKLGEKVVAALVSKHTDKPLRELIEGSLSAVPFGKFITSKILAVIQRAMVDPHQADVADDPHYTLVAGLLNEVLTGNCEWMKPLQAYAPTTMAVVDTGVKAYQMAKEQVLIAVDQVQASLGILPEPEHIQSAYADKPVVLLNSSSVSDNLTQRDLAEVILSQLVHAESSGSTRTPDKLPSTSEVIAKAQEQGKVSAEHADQLQQLTESLSPQQIKPLGERGDIAVEKTWSNTLQSVLAVNHLITQPNQTSEAHTSRVLAEADTTCLDVGGYQVAKAYGSVVGGLALKLPDHQRGYSDTAVEAGWQAWGYLKSFAVNPTEKQLTKAQSMELRTLWNCCSGRADGLAVLTRYLDPDLAKNAVAAPLLDQLRTSDGSGLFDVGAAKLRLANEAAPEIGFEVSTDGLRITLSITASWPILEFGKTGEPMRTPKGDGESRLSATALVQIRLADINQNPDLGMGVGMGLDYGFDYNSANDEPVPPPTVDIYPMGFVSTIENQIQFERQTGSLQ